MIRLLLFGLALGCATSCASTILTPAERGALIGVSQHDWRLATAGDIPGLYASKEIRGPMAASIWKLYYNFDVSGSYTGAALFAEDPPRFEVLSGTWAFAAGQLALDGGEPAETQADFSALRLSGEAGTVVLLREDDS